MFIYLKTFTWYTIVTCLEQKLETSWNCCTKIAVIDFFAKLFFRPLPNCLHFKVNSFAFKFICIGLLHQRVRHCFSYMYKLCFTVYSSVVNCLLTEHFFCTFSLVTSSILVFKEKSHFVEILLYQNLFYLYFSNDKLFYLLSDGWKIYFTKERRLQHSL